MSKPNIYPVKPDFAATAHLNSDQYQAMYQASVSQPEIFWNVQAKNYLTWDQQWTNVCEYDFKQGQASWFNGGKLNLYLIGNMTKLSLHILNSSLQSICKCI